ncbi:keratin-associated protein 5-8-like isoform X2 [Mizuhopecten yessoensis]|uniref:keratin-associated protein 5-8-like isoform X2 n=1 Tax=Mizuhopecten yessoensis TaxID=6573 RepID=UPI000B45ACC3|nr:keratin-associated protein 5-8-like isoform X2 [Mizuhopecten yessoensis]
MGNTSSSDLALDLPVIIIISVICWVAVILIILGIRQMLLSRGVCEAGCGCSLCGSEDSPPCCDCCIAMSESCNCCNPSVGGCLDKCCPNRRSLSCVEILLCQCFGSTNCLTNWCNECGTLQSQSAV